MSPAVLLLLEGSFDFSIGQVLSDGDIQRYIYALHPDFEDDDRIEGDYVLVQVPVASIPESEWETNEELAQRFASTKTPFPPVVLDTQLSFIDGGHRHRAAQIRGDSTIRAFVPVSVASQFE